MRTILLVVGAAFAVLLSSTSAAPIAVTATTATSVPAWSPPLSIVPPPPSGSYPDFVFVPDVGTNTMTIDLGSAQTGAWNVPNTNGVGIYDPEQWVVVFYFNNVVIPPNRHLVFRNHPSRAAVAFLAYTSITVEGTINVSGTTGGSSANGVTAEPGPGGFRGSRSSVAIETSHAGFGPGGAFSSPLPGHIEPRGGSHATQGGGWGPTTHPPGPIYGNAAITQLIGGSGGSGRQQIGGLQSGGGSGGGAILLAANQSIVVDGSVQANGGDGYQLGSGASGSIRLVSDIVDISANAAVSATAGGWGIGGIGRIRIERNNFGGIPPGVNPPASIVTGNAHNSILFQTINRPQLRIVSVAGQSAPLDPRAGVLGTEPADIFAPAPGPGDVVIEGRNIPLSASVFLRATAVAGVTPGEIPVTGPPAGNDTLWTRTVTVDFGGGYTCLQARAVLLP